MASNTGKVTNATASDTAPAITADDEDWMDGAKATFPSMENLAPSVPPNYGDGRLVAIWAKSTGVGKGDNGPYPFVETITVVLDDGPNGDQTDDLVGPAPFQMDLRHSTTGLVTRLAPRVTGVNHKTKVPLRFRPIIGRINTQASRNNKNVAAYSIAEPTADDMVRARAHQDMIKAINAELEAAEKTAEDKEAFE